MKLRLRCAATTIVVLFTLTGCALFENRPESQVITRWNSTDIPNLETDPTGQLQETALLATAEERADFLKLTPSVPQSERAEVEAIDLSSHVILVGSLDACGWISSHIALHDGELDYVVEFEEGVSCAVPAPVLEVWSVDRTDLPATITLRDQRGDGD